MTAPARAGTVPVVAHLERLRADHAAALLEFETDNRAFFASVIPDRGDAYFAEFAQRHQGLLDEQETGQIHMHVLVDDDGAIVGRVNLIDVADHAAELGYRIAQDAAGRGLATDAVKRVCELAATRYGLRRLWAQTTRDNTGSRKVLERNGFTVTGPVVLSGRDGLAYERELSVSPST